MKGPHVPEWPIQSFPFKDMRGNICTFRDFDRRPCVIGKDNGYQLEWHSATWKPLLKLRNKPSCIFMVTSTRICYWRGRMANFKKKKRSFKQITKQLRAVNGHDVHGFSLIQHGIKRRRPPLLCWVTRSKTTSFNLNKGWTASLWMQSVRRHSQREYRVFFFGTELQRVNGNSGSRLICQFLGACRTSLQTWLTAVTNMCWFPFRCHFKGRSWLDSL